jgi:putative transposase
VKERKQMIDRAHPMPISRQCEILELSRSSVYYRAVPIPEADLALMRRIDEIHLKLPFFGSRRIRDRLQREGYTVNRKKVQRLMHLMGISALYPKRRTSLSDQGHRVYPYLLRDVTIERPNQVWCSDICYIPMARGFLYLVAIMDWHSRKVLSWRLSNTLDTQFCVDALEQALRRYGTPEIFNTDQGAQFTSDSFTKILQDAGVRISMDGKGRWIDNVFIERVWRSLKYEEVYLKAYETVAEAIQGIGDYFDLYNEERPHQALARLTPNEVYAGGFTLPEAA